MQQPKKDYDYFYQGTNDTAVILVHGMTGSPAEMNFVAKRLHKQGFSVYIPTLAGHCQGKKAFLHSTWQDWYQSLECVLNKVKKTYDKIYVGGICVGGALALYLAYKNPTLIKAVALYSATFSYDGWAVPFYFKYAPVLVPVGVRIPFIRDIKIKDAYPYGIKSDRIRNFLMNKAKNQEDLIEGGLPYFPARGLYQNYKLMRVIKKILPGVNTPTLLLHAREDDVSSYTNSDYIKNRIGGTCELHLLEDSYHMIHVDQERDKVAKLTADFFKRYQ